MSFTEWEFTLLDREWARLDDLRRYRENQERAWARGTATLSPIRNASGGRHGNQTDTRTAEDTQD